VSAIPTGSAAQPSAESILNAPAGGTGQISEVGPLQSAWNNFTGGINSLGNALNSPTGKVLSTGVAAAGLLKSLTANNNIKGLSGLNSLAGELGALVPQNAAAATGVANQAQGQSAVLENYLTTGTLPPAIQASLDQATNSAIVNLKASYAQRGMSADPASNSELAAGITEIQQNAIINGGSLAATLYGTGVNQEQLASQIYTNLFGTGASGAASAGSAVVNAQTGINNGVVNSVGQLASALGGGSKINVGGTTVTN
jgi:hypothetical protein